MRILHAIYRQSVRSWVGDMSHTYFKARRNYVTRCSMHSFENMRVGLCNPSSKGQAVRKSERMRFVRLFISFSLSLSLSLLPISTLTLIGWQGETLDFVKRFPMFFSSHPRTNEGRRRFLDPPFFIFNWKPTFFSIFLPNWFFESITLSQRQLAA